MYTDDIIQEIRDYRDAYAKRFNYDIKAMLRDLKVKQDAGGRRVVSFPPKRPKGYGQEKKVG